MYAIYAYIDPPNHPNVGIYSIHGASGYYTRGSWHGYERSDRTLLGVMTQTRLMGLPGRTAAPLTPQTTPTDRHIWQSHGVSGVLVSV